MGLFNVIKIANDYNKAKKFLEGKGITLQTAKDLLESLQAVVEKIKPLIKVLKEHLKNKGVEV